MQTVWARFRSLPGWLQAAGRVLLWPLVLAVLMWRSGAVGKVAAVALLVIVGPPWVAVFVAGDVPEPGAPKVTEAPRQHAGSMTDVPGTAETAVVTGDDEVTAKLSACLDPITFRISSGYRA